MGKVLRLTEEEAFYRMNWLLHFAVNKEMWNLLQQSDDDEMNLDAAGIDKLYEISAVARQLALHHTEKNRTKN